MTFPNGCCEWTFECDCVFLDGIDRSLGDTGFSMFEDWSDVDCFPVDGGLPARASVSRLGKKQ